MPPRAGPSPGSIRALGSVLRCAAASASVCVQSPANLSTMINTPAANDARAGHEHATRSKRLRPPTAEPTPPPAVRACELGVPEDQMATNNQVQQQIDFGESTVPAGGTDEGMDDDVHVSPAEAAAVVQAVARGHVVPLGF